MIAPKPEKPKIPPRICMNCFHLGWMNDLRYCRKGVAFPIKKQTCKRYEGWL